jgi:hypothetical protein
MNTSYNIFHIAFMVMGVKESTLLNKLFTLLNIAVIAFIVACGSITANAKNWDIHVYVINFI